MLDQSLFHNFPLIDEWFALEAVKLFITHVEKSSFQFLFSKQEGFDTEIH